MKIDPLSRRDFLKKSSAGALGLLLTQIRMHANPRGISVNLANVLGLIDVAQGLADGNIGANSYWLDNRKKAGSTGQGTLDLSTRLYPGDTIYWIVFSLQVETVTEIHNIRGEGANLIQPQKVVSGDFNWWEGTVPQEASGIYPYSLDIMVEKQVLSLESNLSLNLG